jgi:hypothetical protein
MMTGSRYCSRKLAQGFQTVAAGHHHVEYQQIGSLRLVAQLHQRGFAVVRNVHDKAFALQVFGQQAHRARSSSTIRILGMVVCWFAIH